MTQDLNDVIQRFSRSLDGYDPDLHDTLLQEEAIDCMGEIGYALTLESVTDEQHLLLAGGQLALPKLLITLGRVHNSRYHTLAFRKINSKLIQILDCTSGPVMIDYERIQTNDKQEIEFDSVITPALLAWLKWKFMELRPMQDSGAELRKASLSLVSELERKAMAAVGNARGKINLNKIRQPDQMAGVIATRGHQPYHAPRRRY